MRRIAMIVTTLMAAALCVLIPALAAEDPTIETLPGLRGRATGADGAVRSDWLLLAQYDAATGRFLGIDRSNATETMSFAFRGRDVYMKAYHLNARSEPKTPCTDALAVSTGGTVWHGGTYGSVAVTEGVRAGEKVTFEDVTVLGDLTIMAVDGRSAVTLTRCKVGGETRVIEVEEDTSAPQVERIASSLSPDRDRDGELLGTFSGAVTLYLDEPLYLADPDDPGRAWPVDTADPDDDGRPDGAYALADLVEEKDTSASVELVTDEEGSPGRAASEIRIRLTGADDGDGITFSAGTCDQSGNVSEEALSLTLWIDEQIRDLYAGEDGSMVTASVPVPMLEVPESWDGREDPEDVDAAIGPLVVSVDEDLILDEFVDDDGESVPGDTCSGTVTIVFDRELWAVEDWTDDPPVLSQVDAAPLTVRGKSRRNDFRSAVGLILDESAGSASLILEDAALNEPADTLEIAFDEAADGDCLVLSPALCGEDGVTHPTALYVQVRIGDDGPTVYVTSGWDGREGA